MASSSAPAVAASAPPPATPGALPEAPAALASALTGTWALSPSVSDSMEPMLAVMRVPWLIRKAVASSKPTLVVAVAPGGMSVEQAGFARVVNAYTWGPTKHKTPAGTHEAMAEVLPAPAAGAGAPAAACVVRVAVAMASPHGTIVATYSAGDGATLVVIMEFLPAPGTSTAPVRVRRVFTRKQ
jgi:hypothetical protein